MSLLSIAGATPSDEGFELKSARFDGGDARLERTFPVAGNRRTNTLSVWVKRGKLEHDSEHQYILSNDDDSASGAGRKSSYIAFVGTGSDVDKIRISNDDGSFNFITNARFRDPSAWYHIVWAVDTTLANADVRIKLWVNNELQTWSTASNPALNWELGINSADLHKIGQAGWNTTNDFDGYMAEYYFIDGRALTPSSFGETNEDTNQWQPKNPTDIKQAVTFGTNGFYLPFSNDALADSFADSSESFKSLYFDTTDDKIIMSTALQGGTDNAFSIACWVNFNEFTGQFYSQMPDASTSGRFSISPTGSDGSGGLTAGISGANVASTSSNLDLGTWYHIVLARDDDSWKWYVNGSLDTTATGVSTDQLYNGHPWINARYWNPSFCSFRLAQFATWNVELSSSDVTGIYNSGDKTTNWKTSYSSGMKSYYTMNNVSAGFSADTAATIYDRSGNSNDGTTYGTMVAPTTGHDVEAEGNAKNERISNHNVTANGDAHIIGPKVGSSAISFNVSTSHLSIANSSEFNFGTGAFTFECWLQVQEPIDTSSNDTRALHHFAYGSAEWAFAIGNHSGWSGSGVRLNLWDNGATTNYTSGTIPVADHDWHHIAFSRSGSTLYFFVDGVGYGTASNSSDIQMSLGAPLVGRNGYSNAGFMDEIRWSNVARYTSDFTAPTSAFSSDSNTKLLIHAPSSDESTSFTDSSSTGHTVTASNVKSFIPKVGAGAMALDGSGDYLTVPNSLDWDMGTGSFTIECWARFDAVGDIDTIIERDFGSNQRAFYIAKQANNTILASTGSGSGWICLLYTSHAADE